jgi:GrpB-like predicted nucleotidyltransferase (UPF0157 family)
MAEPADNPPLIGGIERREIRIEPFDRRWPEIFAAHAEKIASALGPVALAIEHIGSTSVPELGAKPIVDMLLVVENSANEAAYLAKLVAAGYVLRVREPDFHEHRMLRTPERDVHVHVLSRGSTEIDRYLTFRDWLRTHTADRQLYEATKRQLAALDWHDMNAYADAKSEVVEAILLRAQAARRQ